jgi:YD repeat-containing protein
VSYRYDASRDLVAVGAGARPGAAWRYEYTAAGRLLSVTDPSGAREGLHDPGA